MRDRILVRQQPQRSSPGTDRVLDGLLHAGHRCGLEEVMCKRREMRLGIGPVAFLEEISDLLMHANALRRAEIVVEGFLDQRVREDVAAKSSMKRPDDPRIGGGDDRLEQRLDRNIRHLPQDVQVKIPPLHRREST